MTVNQVTLCYRLPRPLAPSAVLSHSHTQSRDQCQWPMTGLAGSDGINRHHHSPGPWYIPTRQGSGGVINLRPPEELASIYERAPSETLPDLGSSALVSPTGPQWGHRPGETGRGWGLVPRLSTPIGPRKEGGSLLLCRILYPLGTYTHWFLLRVIGSRTIPRLDETPHRDQQGGESGGPPEIITEN